MLFRSQLHRRREWKDRPIRWRWPSPGTGRRRLSSPAPSTATGARSDCGAGLAAKTMAFSRSWQGATIGAAPNPPYSRCNHFGATGFGRHRRVRFPATAASGADNCEARGSRDGGGHSSQSLRPGSGFASRYTDFPGMRRNDRYMNCFPWRRIGSSPVGHEGGREFMLAS